MLGILFTVLNTMRGHQEEQNNYLMIEVSKVSHEFIKNLVLLVRLKQIGFDESTIKCMNNVHYIQIPSHIKVKRTMKNDQVIHEIIYKDKINIKTVFICNKMQFAYLLLDY